MGALLPILVAAALSAEPDHADFPAAAPTVPGIEASGGASMLVYLSAYAGSTSGALEAALNGPMIGAWRWGAGARLGFGPPRPEGFVRLLDAPKFGRWEPAAGFEGGLTARAEFGDGDKLLRELRNASIADVSPWYFAFQAMPLSYRFGNGVRLSALELQIGTQLAPLGRIVRLQLGLVSVGMTL